MRKENQTFKSAVLSQTDASGSTFNMLVFLVLHLRQHYQLYNLGFFWKNSFWEGIIK
jgi:hypothetical protein